MKLNKLMLCLVFPACLGVQVKAQEFTIDQYQPTIPVLVGKQANPVIRAVLRNSDPNDKTTYRLNNIGLDFEGTTNMADIEHITVHLESKDKGVFLHAIPFAGQRRIADKVSINMSEPISRDSMVFWIAVKLKPKVDLSNKVNVRLTQAFTDKSEITLKPFQGKGLRMGYALHQKMDFGSNTARIPGLTTTKSGTLIAIWDARYENDRDLQGDMDIVIRRSEDKGASWQDPLTVLDMKEFGGLPERFNGVSDANILVDENTGKIFVFGLWMHGVINPETGKNETRLDEFSPVWNHQWRSFGSQPGYDISRSAQLIMTESSDDGKTWSQPRNITKMVKKAEWWLLAPAPGSGITLKDGTLVFPSEGRDKTGLQFSAITYSKDGGKTWTTSNPAYTNTNECMAVQLDDGSIMLNMRERSNRDKMEGNGRAIAVTKDLGKTWKEHPTSRRALIESSCMASLYNYKDVLYFFNPSSKTSRNNLTLKVSFDQGDTWPEKNWMLLDEYNGSGYSCITKVDDDHIAVIYEGSQADMVFQILPTQKIKK